MIGQYRHHRRMRQRQKGVEKRTGGHQSRWSRFIGNTRAAEKALIKDANQRTETNASLAVAEDVDAETFNTALDARTSETASREDVDSTVARYVGLRSAPLNADHAEEERKLVIERQIAEEKRDSSVEEVARELGNFRYIDRLYTKAGTSSGIRILVIVGTLFLSVIEVMSLRSLGGLWLLEKAGITNQFLVLLALSCLVIVANVLTIVAVMKIGELLEHQSVAKRHSWIKVEVKEVVGVLITAIGAMVLQVIILKIRSSSYSTLGNSDLDRSMSLLVSIGVLILAGFEFQFARPATYKAKPIRKFKEDHEEFVSIDRTLHELKNRGLADKLSEAEGLSNVLSPRYQPSAQKYIVGLQRPTDYAAPGVPYPTPLKPDELRIYEESLESEDQGTKKSEASSSGLIKIPSKFQYEAPALSLNGADQPS